MGRPGRRRRAARTGRTVSAEPAISPMSRACSPSPVGADRDAITMGQPDHEHVSARRRGGRRKSDDAGAERRRTRWHGRRAGRSLAALDPIAPKCCAGDRPLVHAGRPVWTRMMVDHYASESIILPARRCRVQVATRKLGFRIGSGEVPLDRMSSNRSWSDKPYVDLYRGRRGFEGEVIRDLVRLKD